MRFGHDARKRLSTFEDLNDLAGLQPFGNPAESVSKIAHRRSFHGETSVSQAVFRKRIGGEFGQQPRDNIMGLLTGLLLHSMEPASDENSQDYEPRDSFK